MLEQVKLRFKRQMEKENSLMSGGGSHNHHGSGDRGSNGGGGSSGHHREGSSGAHAAGVASASGSNNPSIVPSGGVQVLLDAEKEANRLVQQSREYRVERLKEARNEAAAEVAALKRAKNEEYAAFEQEILKSLEADVAAALETTTSDLQQMREAVKGKMDAASQFLVDSVCTITPNLHVNYL